MYRKSGKGIIIHTAEPAIEYEHIKPAIDNHLFTLLKQVDEAYLLFSYPPYEEKCPYIRLRLKERGVEVIEKGV